MRHVKKIRLTNLTQTPGSLEPTLTSEHYVIDYESKESGWFEVSARPPFKKPLHPFSIHFSKVDFVIWDEDQEDSASELPQRVSAIDSDNRYIKENNVSVAVPSASDSPCPVPGCTKYAKHRGRHVFASNVGA